jgi:TPR repeat protein
MLALLWRSVLGLAVAAVVLTGGAMVHTALEARSEPAKLRVLGLQPATRVAPIARGALWLLAAAGNPGGQRALGLLLLRAAQPGHEEGREWLERAAAQGDAQAAWTLASWLRSGAAGPRDPQRELFWLTKAAEGGVAAAHVLLGDAYRHGEGVPVDFERALEHYEAAAAREDPVAIQTLAEAWRSGELGLPQDPERAAALRRDLEHAVHEPRPPFALAGD